MPGPRVDIAIVGDDAGAHAMLNALSGAFTPAKMGSFATDVIVPWLEKRALGRFKAEGDDAVGHWAALKPRTVAIREQAGFGGAHPINVRTGELQDFILSGGADIVASEDALHVSFPRDPGNAELADKFRTAQAGRDNPRTVARPVVGLSPTDLSEILAQLALHVTEEVHSGTGAGVSLI